MYPFFRCIYNSSSTYKWYHMILVFLWLSMITSRSIHVASNNVSFFCYVWVIFHHVYVLHLFHTFICQWNLVCVHVLAVVNSAARNNAVSVSFQGRNFIFSGCVPRSDIAGSYCSSIFGFLRNLHTVLWASLVAQIVKNLQCRRWSLIPVLGRSPGEGNGYPLQYSWLENCMDKESGGLQSMGLQRLGDSWTINTFTFMLLFTSAAPIYIPTSSAGWLPLLYTLFSIYYM